MSAAALQTQQDQEAYETRRAYPAERGANPLYHFAQIAWGDATPERRQFWLREFLSPVEVASFSWVAWADLDRLLQLAVCGAIVDTDYPLFRTMMLRGWM